MFHLRYTLCTPPSGTQQACAGAYHCCGLWLQGNAVVAPQGLSYPTVAATYTQFLVITDNTPTLTHGGGKDDGVVFKVDGSSALPQGLSIAPATGTIFGTPEVTQVCQPQQRRRGPSPRARTVVANAVCARTIQARTTYTIVATNAAGSTSTNISIAVNPRNRNKCTVLPCVRCACVTIDHHTLVHGVITTAIPPAFNYPLARVTMQQFIMLPSLQPTFVGSQPITFTCTLQQPWFAATSHCQAHTLHSFATHIHQPSSCLRASTWMRPMEPSMARQRSCSS